MPLARVRARARWKLCLASDPSMQLAVNCLQAGRAKSSLTLSCLKTRAGSDVALALKTRGGHAPKDPDEPPAGPGPAGQEQHEGAGQGGAGAGERELREHGGGHGQEHVGQEGAEGAGEHRQEFPPKARLGVRQPADQGGALGQLAELQVLVGDLLVDVLHGEALHGRDPAGLQLNHEGWHPLGLGPDGVEARRHGRGLPRPARVPRREVHRLDLEGLLRVLARGLEVLQLLGVGAARGVEVRERARDGLAGGVHEHEAERARHVAEAGPAAQLLVVAHGEGRRLGDDHAGD
mmetsp:Transcript_55312/g.177342  ORF Transcript_55312/g.177342 Transcript_55312/m.177342 type:complete len:292 (-) Transcript_55312:1662-2537(-)